MILKQQRTFPLYYPNPHTPTQTILNNINKIKKQILSQGKVHLTQNVSVWQF